MKQKKMKFGSFLVEKGFLSREQAIDILETQEKDDSKLRPRFGRIAVDKDYLGEKEVNSAFMQYMKEKAK